jgi:hypothetical protein
MLTQSPPFRVGPGSMGTSFDSGTRLTGGSPVKDFDRLLRDLKAEGKADET